MIVAEFIPDTIFIRQKNAFFISTSDATGYVASRTFVGTNPAVDGNKNI